MAKLTHNEILDWLRASDPEQLEALFARANQVRQEHVGDAVHLRGLIEISNHCVRQCHYCGLRAERTILRYRMSREEILACARQAVHLGFGTVVLQAGEDFGIEAEGLAALIRTLKTEMPLAVTLSLGERLQDELLLWKNAGADRYLLRFESSDPALYAAIHPQRGAMPSDRIGQLKQMRAMGYEIGSGVMVGIPGQSYTMLARDIECFAALDLDMIGIGPFLAHPETPLGAHAASLATADQVPATEEMVLKTLALTRIVCPQANLPATTALATINSKNGRENGLLSGGNAFMPILTPAPYRPMYEIYPGRACVQEDAQQCNTCLRHRIQGIGRSVGQGPGGRSARP
ncbi:[FeFe] hydrogenase H-cluster radical SAM maturase HydE [Telmatobacter bradus]|uniref:[FeFe] hydrogenase H-cluster radical SAM maturase HydE n=1 Tax=Telmatobacter bradus TaxID=474953 RepID=UPI003B43242C